ncbi:unnamed protein product [Chrysoparadoxa australica]
MDLILNVGAAPLRHRKGRHCILLLVRREGHHTSDRRHPMAKRALVSWTGGKDCHLALLECRRSEYDIVALVTFAPEATKPFLSHPIPLMKLQAEALGIPHQVQLLKTSTDGITYEEAYRQGMASLAKQHNATHLITGDILDVCSGFMPRAAAGSGLEIVRPLWQREREVMVADIHKAGMEVTISCANIELCGEELARQLVGSQLEGEALRLLRAHGSVDLSGEGGEYHTMVTFVPGIYNHPIKLGEFSCEGEGLPHQKVTDCRKFLHLAWDHE